jgi:UPF0176 protein
MQNNFCIATFYRFFPLENLKSIQLDLENKAKNLQISGLFILGHEGINATVAAPTEDLLAEWKNWIVQYFKLEDLMFKNSYAPSNPFKRFKVKVRAEIVTLKTPELAPNTTQNHHLSAEEWNQVLKQETDFLLIDTRNWYEFNVGTFKGAVNPNIEQFSEFPAWLEKQNFPKEKKMLIFCTGGIRCEKGILDLQRSGYNNVFQLEGGILKYIEEKPNDQFEGECFVFDNRVAVTQDLLPSNTYKLCPHCGQPGLNKINCSRCEKPGQVCDQCAQLDWKKETCSKDCAYQYRLRPHKFVRPSL